MSVTRGSTARPAVDCAGQLPADRRGGVMYSKPKVERFGSLRELTQWGGSLFLLQNGLLPGCGPSGNRPPKCWDSRS